MKFVVTDDSTDNTIAAVNSVVVDLIMAVILVSLVMLLFLRSYRNALIVAVAIPTSLITAFGTMWLLGYTLNLMTLLAMSLVIGVLVDDATVVLETYNAIWIWAKTSEKQQWTDEWKLVFLLFQLLWWT